MYGLKRTDVINITILFKYWPEFIYFNDCLFCFNAFYLLYVIYIRCLTVELEIILPAARELAHDLMIVICFDYLAFSACRDFMSSRNFSAAPLSIKENS